MYAVSFNNNLFELQAENGPVQGIKTNSKTSHNLHNMLKDVRKSFAVTASENVAKV